MDWWAVGLAVVGSLFIFLPLLGASFSERERRRDQEQEDHLVESAAELVAEAMMKGSLHEAAIRDLVEAACRRFLPRRWHRSRGQGPRYTKAVFMRSVMAYAIGHVLAHGRLPSGIREVRAEFVGAVWFDPTIAGRDGT